jgi:hypothetical protein
MQRRKVLKQGALVGGAALAALAPSVALGDGDEGAHGLEGAWIGSTNAGSSFPPFKALYTFAPGGGMVTSSSIDLSSRSLSTPGYGAWTRTAGRTFGFAFDAFVFDPQGNPAGVVKARATATLDTTGDAWSGAFKFDVFAPNGALVFSGGGTHDATRIRVVSL